MGWCVARSPKIRKSRILSTMTASWHDQLARALWTTGGIGEMGLNLRSRPPRLSLQAVESLKTSLLNPYWRLRGIAKVVVRIPHKGINDQKTLAAMLMPLTGGDEVLASLQDGLKEHQKAIAKSIGWYFEAGHLEFSLSLLSGCLTIYGSRFFLGYPRYPELRRTTADQIRYLRETQTRPLQQCCGHCFSRVLYASARTPDLGGIDLHPCARLLGHAECWQGSRGSTQGSAAGAESQSCLGCDRKGIPFRPIAWLFSSWSKLRRRCHRKEPVRAHHMIIQYLEIKSRRSCKVKLGR